MVAVLREESGLIVRDRDAESVIQKLRKRGVEVVYTEQVEQWGEMADCCVFRETGRQCPFCECGGKNMRIRGGEG
jgi:hypothetical protein